MKFSIKHLAFGLTLAAGVSGHAMAVGTQAGTDINNRATLSYQVGGGNTLSIESSPTGNTGPSGSDTTFKVDRRLDVEVTGGGETPVDKGTVDAVIKFTLTNSGNANQGVIVTTVVDSGDSFDAVRPAPTTAVSLCLDEGNGTYDGTETCVTGTSPSIEIDTLLHAAGSNSVDLFLVGDIPTSVVNGNRANYSLVAQVGEVGADNDATNTDVVAITVDDNGVDKNANSSNKNTMLDLLADEAGTVAGDAARDGKHSADGSYVVEAADLVVSKVATVVWDPISCTNPEPTGVVANCDAANGSASPKAIPGALIEYTIRINNGSPFEAESVSLSDDLTAEVATNSTVEFVVDSFSDVGDPDGNVLTPDGCPAGGNCGILINKDEGDTDVLQVHTNVDDTGPGLYSDDSDWSETSPNTVTSSLDGGLVPGNTTMTLTFRVRVLQ